LSIVRKITIILLGIRKEMVQPFIYFQAIGSVIVLVCALIYILIYFFVSLDWKGAIFGGIVLTFYVIILRVIIYINKFLFDNKK